MLARLCKILLENSMEIHDLTVEILDALICFHIMLTSPQLDYSVSNTFFGFPLLLLGFYHNVL